jgi:small subunit ribosomal protein S27Ae
VPEKAKDTKKTEEKPKPEKAGKVEKVEKAKEPEKAKEAKEAPPVEKKEEKKKAERKPKKKRPGVFSHYKVEKEGFKRLLPFCERCGPGYFMANHGNRFTCGHCGYTKYRSAETQPSQ